MMLICPHSGLGNQIGNYVFAQFLIEKGFNNIKFLITKDENLDRAYVLDKFNTNIEQASKEDMEAFLKKAPPPLFYGLLLKNMFFRKRTYFNSLYKVLARIRREYGIYPKKTPSFLSKTLSFEDVLKYGCNSCAICDCYAPIKEFNNEKFREKMRTHFTLKDPLDEENTRILDMIKNSKNPVGVHIRRGDYLNLKIPVVRKEFLFEKIGFLEKNLDGAEFFIFSDEINWAKETLKAFNNVHFVDINDETHGYLDFILMNECTHRIYSASSFSVWLKYFNPNLNSVEFMPEKEDLIIEP